MSMSQSYPLLGTNTTSAISKYKRRGAASGKALCAKVYGGGKELRESLLLVSLIV